MSNQAVVRPPAKFSNNADQEVQFWEMTCLGDPIQGDNAATKLSSSESALSDV